MPLPAPASLPPYPAYTPSGVEWLGKGAGPLARLPGAGKGGGGRES